MKKLILTIFTLLFVIQIASGISKVAVLDASLGAGVDINAAAIVADTLNEQFVKSNDFIAIDRAYISSIQQEKKFQLSGDVNQADIKELGVTFGAEFICIANVSLLGSTYTVSARLIEVETAQVVSQESARKQGQIDVLFDVAEEVGNKLIGKELSNKASQPEVEKKQTEPAPAPAGTEAPAKKPQPFSRMSISYMMPSYNGSGYDWLDTTLWDYETWTYGIDIHYLMPFGQYFYSALSGSFGFQDVYDWVLDTNSNSLTNLDLRATIGGIFSLGYTLQFFGGVGFGYQFLQRGEFWSINFESEAGSFVYGFELGGDYRLNDFVFSLRMQTGTSTFPGYTVFNELDQDLGYTAFMIGLGYVF